MNIYLQMKNIRYLSKPRVSSWTMKIIQIRAAGSSGSISSRGVTSFSLCEAGGWLCPKLSYLDPRPLYGR